MNNLFTTPKDGYDVMDILQELTLDFMKEANAIKPPYTECRIDSLSYDGTEAELKVSIIQDYTVTNTLTYNYKVWEFDVDHYDYVLALTREEQFEDIKSDLLSDFNEIIS